MNKTPGAVPARRTPVHSSSVSVSELASIISAGGRTIIISTASVFALVAVYTFLTKPVYESTARVIIDFQGERGGHGALDFNGSVAATKITNEIETLNSYSLSESVAVALLRKMSSGEFGRSLPPILSSRPGENAQDSLAWIEEVAGRLAGSTEFIPVKESDIIKISARSTDPREAALIANTYTGVYVERNLALSRAKSRSVREFLQSQLQAKQTLLDSAEAAVRVYMQKSGTVSMESETSKLVQQLATLEATRDALDVEIKSRDKTLQSYRTELAIQEPIIAKAIGESNDSYIHMLQEQLARLEVQRDVGLAQNPGMANQQMIAPQLRDVDTQIETLKKNLQERTRSYLSTLTPSERPGGGNEGAAPYLAQLKEKIIEQKIELDGLRARRQALARVIGDYDKQFNQLPRKSIDLARLQRARLSTEKLYTLVDEKYNEAAITEKSEFGSVNVVDAAAVPQKPVSPKVGVNLILGFLLGAGLGLAIVYTRRALDTKVRTPGDIKRLGVPALTVVSRFELNGAPGGRTPHSTAHPDGMDRHLVTHLRRTSPLVESYQHLLTALRYSQMHKQVRIVLVTSVKKGEGKSITISNLAVVAAESDRRVLVIDADLRRPVLHTIFGQPREPGVMDVVNGGKLSGVVCGNVVPNLHLVCSGANPSNPSAVIGSAALRDLLTSVNKDYDLVLVDSPPIFAVNDALILAAIVDGIILVTSAGETTRTELEEGIDALGEMRTKLLGVVLNKFDLGKTHAAVPGGYGYGYGQYGNGYY